MMTKLRYEKATTIELRKHAQFDEKWVQARIEEDSSLLNLGDLDVVHVEKVQKGAGRLDLQLEDPDGEIRYAVEIQLGATDPSHIIRTIEYWDNEQRKSPKYKHCAVIIAEEITGRFLNVISLFNKSVPLIAIEMRALQLGEVVTLNFTTVLNLFESHEDEPDDDDRSGPPSWEGRPSLQVVEACLSLLKEIDPNIDKTERKQFIGLEINGRVNNFVTFAPKLNFVRVWAKVDWKPWADKLQEARLLVLPIGSNPHRIKFRLANGEFQKCKPLLKQLFAEAYSNRAE